MTRKDDVVARARRCLGVRFRAQGRSIDHGLDCVGVAAFAYDREVPRNYALRGGDPTEIAAMIEAAGLRPIDREMADAGDLLLIAASYWQLHLVILTGQGFVHADAGLRRVVETPGRPRDTMLAAWELR